MTEIGTDYQGLISNLNNQGIKTTNIHYEYGEADFSMYGNALSPELKAELMASFDEEHMEEDLALQAKIAGLYTGRSVINSGDFVKLCNSMGLEVQIKYEKTNYISDWKAGNKNNAAHEGHIAVYTISDGMGGEIKIADANGNGALESEEIFMNQILGGINNDLAGMTPIETDGLDAQNDILSVEESQAVIVPTYEGNPIEVAAAKTQQKNFNQLVEQYMEQGCKKYEAVRKANLHFNSNLSYTGKKDEIIQPKTPSAPASQTVPDQQEQYATV